MPGRVLPACLVLGSAGLLLAVAAGEPIHIVHIMADDTGWNDLGYKNSLINSPNIDRLAMEGIRLTRHHAFKVCSPTRSSFHTGRYAFSMGLYDNSAEAVWYKVNDQAVPLNFTLLPALLKRQGYVTHAVGKWHLGYTTKAYTPTHRGYDTFYGYYSAMTEDYWEHTHSISSGCDVHSGRDLHDSTAGGGLQPGTDNGTYEATLFGQRAVDLIHAHANSTADTPFFMYMAFHNEHDPHQAPLDSLTEQLVGHIRSDTYKVTAALIQTMDAQVGHIVDALNSTSMLKNCVIGFSSDNGGPLDHANNWPFRGGKHTYYEGGVRSEAFIWSPLLPASRRGTEWPGLFHIADWMYTYAVGVAGLPLDAAMDAGPYPNDGFNVWEAFTSSDPNAPSPRTEVVHMVHSPKYYPGNCTLATFASRNCPAVITLGEMKLMLGFVGDPRIVSLNETAGMPVGSPIPFGQSGGTCNVRPSMANQLEAELSADQFVVNDIPDPNCSRGILSPVDNRTCCAASCLKCGGATCSAAPGGKTNCCRGEIDKQGRFCNLVGPPCKEVDAPTPPSPFSNRCTSPKFGGMPKPTPDGPCVDGCLFNLTADPTESVNLFKDPSFTKLIYTMKLRLQELGNAAPPWAAVPEVQHMTTDQLNALK